MIFSDLIKKLKGMSFGATAFKSKYIIQSLNKFTKFKF